MFIYALIGLAVPAKVASSFPKSPPGFAAALSLMEPGAGVLSVEFKVNLLTPARGKLFRAVGRVVRAGRNVTVVSGELRVVDEDKSGALVAIMTGTMMTVRDRLGLLD